MKFRLKFCPDWAAKQDLTRYGIWDLYGVEGDYDSFRSTYPEVVWEAFCKCSRGHTHVADWMVNAHDRQMNKYANSRR